MRLRSCFGAGGHSNIAEAAAASEAPPHWTSSLAPPHWRRPRVNVPVTVAAGPSDSGNAGPLSAAVQSQASDKLSVRAPSRPFKSQAKSVRVFQWRDFEPRHGGLTELSGTSELTRVARLR